jgi:hypothetical protein
LSSLKLLKADENDDREGCKSYAKSDVSVATARIWRRRRRRRRI